MKKQNSEQSSYKKKERNQNRSFNNSLIQIRSSKIITFRPFSGKTLLKLAKEVLYGMNFLQENQMVHADLRPELIGVPILKDHNFRLLDRLGDPSPPIKVQSNNLKENKTIYMAPAVFRALAKRRSKVKHNPFKSDVFSLGMIILEAGLLAPVQRVYDSEMRGIDETELVELVEGFIDRYPDDTVLQETLMVMLEFSEKLREGPRKLLATIRRLRAEEVEEGRAKESTMWGVNETMGQLHITDNGYRLKNAEKINYSNFYRFERHPSLGAEEPEALRQSLADRIRGKPESQSLVETMGNVQEEEPELEGAGSGASQEDFENVFKQTNEFKNNEDMDDSAPERKTLDSFQEHEMRIDERKKEVE